VSALPGVEQASSGFSVPWRDGRALSITLAFAADGATRKNGQRIWRRITGRFARLFRNTGVPLVEGRDFATRTRMARTEW